MKSSSLKAELLKGILMAEMSSFGSLFFSGVSLFSGLVQLPVIMTVILIVPRVIFDYGTKLMQDDYATNEEAILDSKPLTFDFIIGKVLSLISMSNLYIQKALRYPLILKLY